MSGLLNEAKKIKKRLLMDERSFNLVVAKDQVLYDSLVADIEDGDENITIIMCLFNREVNNGNEIFNSA